MRFSISVLPKSHGFYSLHLIFDEESKNRSLEGLRECIKDLLGKLTIWHNLAQSLGIRSCEALLYTPKFILNDSLPSNDVTIFFFLFII